LGSTRALVLLVLTGCSEAEICTSAEFEAALSGDRVEVGACRIDGDYAIDHPIVIVGQSGASLAGSFDFTTAGNVQISNLSIESPSGAAIRAESTTILIEDVDITTELGVGIALQNCTAQLINVTIDGSIDVSNPPSLPINFGIADASTHGLVAFAGTTTIDQLEISGTAAAGALFAGTAVAWNGGRVFDSLGVGVLAEGGVAGIANVEIDGIVQGFELAPAYGAVFVGNGGYDTTNLHVTGTQGIGVAQIGADGNHIDLEADANSVAGVWVERGDVELTGNLHDNLFSSFVGVETGTIDIHDATIDRTVKRIRQVELLGSIEVGDGIQVVSPTTMTSIHGVTMNGNERAGLLLDLPAQHGTISLTDLEITVTSSASAAAVAQGSPPPGWDQGVARNGTDAAADASFAGTLDVLGVIAPCDHPRGTGLVRLTDLGL